MITRAKTEIDILSNSQIEVSGVLDENSGFEDAFAHLTAQEIWVDMSRVELINSFGVRQWTRSIALSLAKVHFVNIAPVVVEQICLIPEFLGYKGQVDSFWANYLCPHCHNNDKFLFQVGVDVQPGLEDYSEGPPRDCTVCKKPSEIDHDPEFFFTFLRLPRHD